VPRTAIIALVLVGCLLVAGCIGGSVPGTRESPVEPQPLPARPATLTNSSVLEYTVAYEGVYLHNRSVSEYDASAIAAIDTCEYPAEDPQDGGLDYWIERRVGGEFYLTLRCPVDVENRGAEQSGSGMIGKWTTYAVTPETTSRVELGTNVLGVRNRTVNFDDEPHDVAVTVASVGEGSGDPVVEGVHHLDAGSYETVRALAPRNGSFEVRVRVDGGTSSSYRASAAAGENLLARTGIYVSPDGEPVVDRRTETYLDG